MNRLGKLCLVLGNVGMLLTWYWVGIVKDLKALLQILGFLRILYEGFFSGS